MTPNPAFQGGFVSPELTLNATTLGENVSAPRDATNVRGAWSTPLVQESTVGDDTPVRSVVKSDPPEWVWVEEVLTAAEYAGQVPLTKWRTLLVRCAVDKSMTPTLKAVGFYLSIVVRTRTCATFKSERTMSTEAGWSRTSVRTSLDRLEDLGWIARTNRGHGKTAMVWLTWPLHFSTGARGVPELVHLKTPLVQDVYLTGAPGDSTGSPGEPDCSLAERETETTTERAAELARLIRSQHFGGES